MSGPCWAAAPPPGCPTSITGRPSEAGSAVGRYIRAPMSEQMRSHPTSDPQWAARGGPAARVSRGDGLQGGVPPQNESVPVARASRGAGLQGGVPPQNESVPVARASRGAGLQGGVPPQNESSRAAVRALVGAAAVALIAIVGTGTAGLAGLSSAARQLAQPPPSDTVLYDRTGQVVLADLHPSGYQSYQVPFSAMGRYLPQATVAIEDANFWKEPGVNPRSMARAAWTDIRARAVVEGGSTITQQLVKL